MISLWIYLIAAIIEQKINTSAQCMRLAYSTLGDESCFWGQQCYFWNCYMAY